MSKNLGGQIFIIIVTVCRNRDIKPIREVETDTLNPFERLWRPTLKAAIVVNSAYRVLKNVKVSINLRYKSVKR